MPASKTQTPVDEETVKADRLTKLNNRLVSRHRLPFGVDSAHPVEMGTNLFALLRERMGWTDAYLEQINDPSYPPLKDTAEIVKALHWIKTTGQKVVVMPDFDMDGISAGVLGYAGLSELGFDVELYVPDYRRGHDILPEAVDELVARHPGVQAVITCDAGVNSQEGIRRGRDHGLVMLITDHHVQLPTEADGSAVSPAQLIINPERIDETYPHPAICGAFVFFQVLMSYTETHAPSQRGDIAMLKLFAGLGTVGDVMPLQFENRQIVRDSLSLARMLRNSLPSADIVTPYEVSQSVLMTILEAGRHHPVFVAAFRGFAFVLQSWREHGSLRSTSDLKADFYAFYLAPAFNALRRIGAPMKTAFDVFVAPNPDAQLKSARQIIQWNEERKELTEHWVKEIQNRDQPLAPHVWFTDAPSGMLGLLAGKILSEHGVPVVVIHDPGHPDLQHGGSARAPMWFPVISMLTASGYTAIGHEQACGVRASPLAQLAEIAQLLADQTAVLRTQIELQKQGSDAPLEYDLALGSIAYGHTKPDGAIGDAEMMLELARRIDALAPFGHQFPRPTIRLIVNLSRCTMGVLGEDQTHLRIIMPNGMKLLWWNAATYLSDLKDLAESPTPGESIVEFDVDLSVNQFLGDQSPQAIIQQAHLPDRD